MHFSSEFSATTDRMAAFSADATHYAVLDCAADADGVALRRAYHRASVRCHPDKPGGDAAAFRRVQAAWETLRDDGRRRDYDASLAAAAAADDVCVWCELRPSDFSRADDGVLEYACRCGGAYALEDEDLAGGGDVLLGCDGCSCVVRVRRGDARGADA